MDSDFLFTSFLILSAAVGGALGAAMVTGTVFCDQCKDGQVSLFDYPLYGIKVNLACTGSDGQSMTLREETTNWLGNYAMRFDGAPDLSHCYAQVTGGGGQGPNGCGAAAGPAENLKLMFNMFDMEMYTVDPLLAQPAEPMPFCPRSAAPSPTYPPPPAAVHQVPALPPVPFFEDSACPHQKWIMPEFSCYWRVVTPETRVGIVFGLIAARQYGPDITLGQGLRGRGAPYGALLREAITALLNSYQNIRFPYNTLDVIERLNLALVGQTQLVLHTALDFTRANSGVGTNSTCRFTTCT